MTRRKRSAPVNVRIESDGKRQRLGRPVRDASDELRMPLTRRDIQLAEKKWEAYRLDEPENFGECVLATVVSKIADAEVLIFRRHAYVALPDDEYTLRYEISPECAAIVKLNDEGRFSEIPPNVTLVLRPPTPSRRLVAMRAHNRAHQDHYRVGTGRKQRPSDPYRGQWRNGVHSSA